MKIIDYPVRHSYEVAGGSNINRILEVLTATLIFVLPVLALFILSK